MPVQFILGRAGTGKTQHLLQRMTELTRADPLGTPIYWLLPRQATFQAERLLTKLLGSFSRIRVVSFDQLGKEILVQCGDIGIPEVTALGRRMVIGHLLRIHKEQLKFYSQSAHRRGLAAELDATFGEFERAGLDAPALCDLLQSLQPDDRTGPDLQDKLADLHLLLDAYDKYIGQERLDPQRRLARILEHVTDCALLENAQVFVDDCYDFTSHERQFLTAIAGRVHDTTISLLIDPDSHAVKNPTGLMAELSIFHRTERTYRSLVHSLAQAAIPIMAPIVFRGNHRPVAADLIAIERGLFTLTAEPAHAECIEAIEAPDARAEVDAVARRIRSLVTDGTRYRQIGVLVRDSAEYQDIIDASFREHGLPYFADRRRTAAHHPLLQMVRAALQIARHGWPDDAVMTLVKTRLAGLSDDQADELENFVLQHRIHGRTWQSAEPWKFTRDLITAEDESGQPILTDSDRIDLYRRSLNEKLAPLLDIKKTTTVRDIATRIFATLELFAVRTTLRDWMQQAEIATDLERRDEHQQIWSQVVRLFDEMVGLLGNETITLVDFIDVLDSGLESFDLALTPVKVDQILVGQLDRTRPPELKIVFVLGMNEGSFPRLAREQSVITDRERRSLQQRNIDLDPDTDRRLLDERFLLYLAFTRASHRLIISRPKAQSNARATSPSSFWLESFRLAPDMPIQSISRALHPEVQNIGTPRQMVSSLMRWVRTGAAAANDDTWPALYQWLVTSPVDDRIKMMRDQAWPALRYANTARLDADIARRLHPVPLQVNVKQLETLAECPFRHFARYGLKLRDRDEPDVTGIDLSNAYHDILQNLVADLLETRTDWCTLKPAEAQQMIKLHATEISRRLRGELMLSSARNRHMLDRIERNLEQAVATMTEIHRRGSYRPAYVNIRFGANARLPAYALTAPSGAQVHLRGQIDRVDLNTAHTGFVVDDYKMTAGPLALDRVYHGLSMQLLACLLVIQANGQRLVGQKLTPAAAFLLQLLRSPQKVDHPSEAIAPEDPNFSLRIKPRGIIDSRAIKSLDRQLVQGASDVVNVFLNQDGKHGRTAFSDAAGQTDFEALLKHVEKRLGELADRVTAGDIAVTPYKMAQQTPCSRCEFRSVCRFEPGLDRYRMLPAMKRDDVLAAVTGAAKEV